MKKICLLIISSLLMISLYAQETPEPQKKKNNINLSGRANDHVMLQIGYTGWAGIPDSINNSGLSKSINAYFMFDFPFKTSPKMSIGVGAGVSSDQIKFSKTFVGIKDPTPTLRFTDQSDTVHFKRGKLVTAYLEAPIEIRFTADPLNSDKSFKFAVGVKVGTMLSAHTRYKDLEDVNGNSINQYVMKEASKRFFNSTRLSAIARVGWGHFSIYGSYQISSLFKDGVAPVIRPYSIGLNLSGL
jgi:hypothetical protein